MSTLAASTLRMALNAASRDNITERRTGKNPVIWIGNQVKFQCALFTAEAASASLVDDFSNITQVNLVIRDTTASGTVLVNKSIVKASFDNLALVYTDWTADTDQHFTFDLDDTDTNQTAGTFWWAIEVVTTGSGVITVGTGTGTWKEDGIGTAGAPTAADYTSYSKVESDARYIVAGLGLTNKVAVPSTSGDAGAVGDFAHNTTHLYIYTGDGATHSWLKIAGANSF